MLIDAVGGMKLEGDLLERMLAAGVRVSRFRPVKPYAAKRVANRTHRKILVADGRAGLTGGVAAARETLDLTAAYFAPRPAFTDALRDAAERDVRVRVLVPGENIDKPPVWVAGRASYDALVGAGVEVYEYQPTMLHAKTMTVDGAWSAVGSANFDNRSFQLNDEATLCVTSDAFAGKLTAQFERDLEVSERIAPERWGRRGPLQRAGESLFKLARREL